VTLNCGWCICHHMTWTISRYIAGGHKRTIARDFCPAACWFDSTTGGRGQSCNTTTDDWLFGQLTTCWPRATPSTNILCSCPQEWTSHQYTTDDWFWGQLHNLLVEGGSPSPTVVRCPKSQSSVVLLHDWPRPPVVLSNQQAAGQQSRATVLVGPPAITARSSSCHVMANGPITVQSHWTLCNNI
jgi:hypothetical protein